MKSKITLATAMLSLLLLNVAACDDDANTDDTDTGSETDTGNGAGDTGGGETDTGNGDSDTGGGETDTGEGSGDGEDCDVAAKVAEAIGLVDEVSGADAEISLDEETDIYSAQIDASAGGPAGAATSPYIYLDIAGAEIVAITDVESVDSADWTLGFKRSTIRINSGDSGAGGWMVGRLDDTSWEAVTESPGRGEVDWTAEDFVDADTCEVALEGRDTFKTAFGEWYDYNPETHAVGAPEGTIFVLYNSATHATYKLEIVEYNSGDFNLRWAAF